MRYDIARPAANVSGIAETDKLPRICLASSLQETNAAKADAYYILLSSLLVVDFHEALHRLPMADHNYDLLFQVRELFVGDFPKVC